MNSNTAPALTPYGYVSPHTKNPGATEYLRATLHHLLLTKDIPELERKLRYYATEKWPPASKMSQELWFSAVYQHNTEGVTFLTATSTEKPFHFSLDDAVLAIKNSDDTEWLLAIPEVLAAWIKQTPIVWPNWSWCNHHKLTEKAQLTFDTFHNVLSCQPPEFHTRLKAFIAGHGMDALQEDGVFLKTIDYYSEPSKKQLKVAATSKKPYYDVPRLEQYWPGFSTYMQTLDSLSYSGESKVKKLQQFLFRKTATPVEEVTPLPDLDF